MMEHGSSTEHTSNTFELRTALARLGLSEYEGRLQENGFEDWENVTNITETDMAELGFKLGDRRKLQRAIREYGSSSASHGEYRTGNFPLSSEGLPAIGEHSKVSPGSSQQAARTTRPYRRHPRPDPNAPHKPKTAYVLFGEHVRQDPALSQSSFAELAKETGKRWRELSDEERVAIWDTPTADRLQAYREELEHYKRTENYQNYQTYLKNFKQQQHNPERAILTDNKTSSNSESVSVHQRRASQGQEEFETAHEESDGAEDLDLKGQSQDKTLLITSGFEDMRHISNMEGRLQETTSPIMPRMEEVRDTPNLDDQLQGMASPVASGMEEVRTVAKALGINPHSTRVAAFPQEAMTTKAVQAFLHGTGSLLYLWDQDEALDLVKSVYHPQSESTPVHATEVFAMSAVGSYCDGEAHTVLLQEKFLHFFLYMLSSSSNVSDLRRMRLFACLAICRFTNSVESARILMSKSLMLFDCRHNRLTARSFSPQYWKANIYVSVI